MTTFIIILIVLAVLAVVLIAYSKTIQKHIHEHQDIELRKWSVKQVTCTPELQVSDAESIYLFIKKRITWNLDRPDCESTNDKTS